MLLHVVTTVLVAIVSEKGIWQRKLWQKSPIDNQPIKKKRKKEKNLENLLIIGQIIKQTNKNKQKQTNKNKQTKQTVL